MMKKSYSGKERRVYPRWIIENKVVFCRESSNTEYSGCTRDLSCSGASFLTDVKVRAGQRLKMNICLSDSETILLHGRVMWLKRAGDQFCMGFHFFDISQDEQSFILKHAYELNHDKIVNHWFKDWNG